MVHYTTKDTMSDKPIKTLHSHVRWHCQWYSVREDQVQLPDGQEGVYNVVDRGRGAVFIIPVLQNGDVVLIRHYRYPVEEWLWEIPAGGIEANDTPEETAHRELSEEIGGTTEHLELCHTFYTMPGISNELSYVFIARDVQLTRPSHETTEIIHIHQFDISQVEKMILDGKVKDGPSALSLFHSLPRLKSTTA